MPGRFSVPYGPSDLHQSGRYPKLRYEEQVELPLLELLARGEARLQRDYEAFVQTAARIDLKRTPAEVMKSLSDDHPSAENLVPSVRRSVEAARRFVAEKGIVTIPSEVRPRIEETPPYARSGSFASMDTPAPTRRRRPRLSTTSPPSSPTGTPRIGRSTCACTTHPPWR